MSRAQPGTPRAGQLTPVDGLSPETARAVIEHLTPLITPARRARMQAALDSRTRDLVIVLEDLANEHNGSAVFRTAEALGLLEAHVVESVAGQFQVSRRVSKGTQKWLDLRRWTRTPDALASLKARGFAVYVSTLHGSAVDVAQLPIDRPLAVVFGNEQEGVSDAAKAAADGFFRIPMVGFVESFNISVAAAITVYDQVTRRAPQGGFPPLAPDDAARVHAAWLVRSVRSADTVLERFGLPVPVMPEHAWVETLEREPSDQDGAAAGEADRPG